MDPRKLSMTGNRADPAFMVKSKMTSTWPACIACKAAELQGEHLAEAFYRKLMEVIQIESKNGSDEHVYLEVVKEVGLDAAKLSSDAKSKEVLDAFYKDREAMQKDDVSFLTLIITNRKGEKEIIGEEFTAKKYEQAIEKLSEGKLEKKTPIDILEYLERHRQFLVTSKEIAEVFTTSEQDAVNRLSTLQEGGLVRAEKFEFATYWMPIQSSKRKELSIDEVKAAHVTASAEVSSETDLVTIVTKAVQNLYTQVALKPNKTYHFPVGRAATEYVGYPEEEISRIPESAVESFAGVGYPHAAGAISRGDTVLDVGSGSGTDILVASLITGPNGNEFGLDFTESMIAKAEANIATMGSKNVKIIRGNAMEIPLPNSSVDVVTSNGVLNLVPNKRKAFSEIYRVLKPGGRIQIADIVTETDVQKTCGLVPQLWADCIGGASVESEYLKTIEHAGFRDVRIIKRIDYFGASSSEQTKRLTKSFGAESVVITARK